jgi:antitoxin component HigA of HigAB toxin-antitoxin module
LRPIRNEAEADRAQAMMDRLTDRGEDDLADDEADYLDVLSNLFMAWERTQESWLDDAPPSPGRMIAHLMEARGAGADEVARATGLAAARMTELMDPATAGPTETEVATLAAYFHVTPDTIQG